MQANFCDQGSGWACDELGILRAPRATGTTPTRRNGCSKDARSASPPACAQPALTVGDAGSTLARARRPPSTTGRLSCGEAKVRSRDRSPAAAALARVPQGWPDTCEERIREACRWRFNLPMLAVLLRVLRAELVRRARARGAQEHLLAIRERQVPAVGAARSVLRLIAVDHQTSVPAVSDPS